MVVNTTYTSNGIFFQMFTRFSFCWLHSFLLLQLRKCLYVWLDGCLRRYHLFHNIIYIDVDSLIIVENILFCWFRKLKALLWCLVNRIMFMYECWNNETMAFERNKLWISSRSAQQQRKKKQKNRGKEKKSEKN